MRTQSGIDPRSPSHGGIGAGHRPLTDAEKARYGRQIRVPGFGETAQARLLAAHALIVGVGGLGSPAAMYLAAAGVGTLVLSDFDRVELSNLQRQVIHRQHSVGEPKALSARATLRDLNPACTVVPLDRALDDEELRAEAERADVVLDCSDNFETRFQLNRICVETRTPLVSGSATRADGQIVSFLPGEPDSPCLRCLHREDLSAVETCAAEGILAPVVGVIGVLQAQQALLILTGQHHALIGTLLLFDGRGMDWRRLAVPRNPACPVCGAPAPAPSREGDRDEPF